MNSIDDIRFVIPAEVDVVELIIVIPSEVPVYRDEIEESRLKLRFLRSVSTPSASKLQSK